MSIPQKLPSTVTVTIKDGECTEYTDIQITLKQKDVKFIFDPSVVDDETLTFSLTAAQAKQLDTSPVSWQILAKDADGTNIYTPVYTVSVDYILEDWKNA